MIVDQIIQEAQDYEGMFNDIFKLDASPGTGESGASRQADPRLRQEITQDINWARKTLRKSDRIIWFLRWSKIWYQLSGGIWSGGRADAALSGALQQYNRRFQTGYLAGDLLSPPVMKQQLGHFLSLPVPEIQNYILRTESPRQLFDLFAGYETAWRRRIEEERSLIMPESEDEILISFQDGYAWWLLPRGGCPIEAKAMGHCGNLPSQRSGDQILSLRRKVQRGDMVRWYPVATFILDADGQLGEMKGRGNDKPAQKYHPYIVELLRHHMILGIKGGGYMPENNFSMTDLDPQAREQLIAEKPELKGLLGYYEEEGMTERVLDMLGTKLRERDLPSYESYDAEKRDFLLNRYRDLEQFVSTNGDDVLEKLLTLRERAEDAHSDMLSVKANLNDQVLRRFLEMLPHPTFSDVSKSVGIDPATSNAKRLVARHLEYYGGPMFDGIEQAFAAASGHQAMIQALDDRIADYVNEGWSFDCSYVWAALVNPSDLVDSAIEIRISEADLVYIATADDDGYDEHAYDAQKVAYNRSWDDIDWESTNEHRRENKLIRRKSGGRSRDYEDTEFGDPEHIEFDTGDLIDAAVGIYLNPRKSTPTIRDPRQFELTLEESAPPRRYRRMVHGIRSIPRHRACHCSMIDRQHHDLPTERTHDRARYA
jgi:hypothetical protein